MTAATLPSLRAAQPVTDRPTPPVRIEATALDRYLRAYEADDSDAMDAAADAMLRGYEQRTEDV